MIKKENFFFQKKIKVKTNSSSFQAAENNEQSQTNQINNNDLNNNSDQSLFSSEESVRDTLDSIIDKFIADQQNEEANSNFDQDYIDNINCQNLNSEDKIDEKDYEKNFFNKNIIKDNLEKYFVVSTYKSTMVINSFKIKIFNEGEKNSAEETNKNDKNNIDENIIENAISITFNEKNSKDCLKEEKEKSAVKFQKIVLCNGKINLVKNFLKKKFKNEPLNHNLKREILGYISSSRYEFIYISQLFNMLIVGNRCGDFQFYLLKINVDIFKDKLNYNERQLNKNNNIRDEKDEYELSFEEKPVFMLSHKNSICGFKVIEFQDIKDLRNNFLEIYFIDMQGRIECYKLNYLIN